LLERVSHSGKKEVQTGGAMGPRKSRTWVLEIDVEVLRRSLPDHQRMTQCFYPDHYHATAPDCRPPHRLPDAEERL
jgi:hypothetical protein